MGSLTRGGIVGRATNKPTFTTSASTASVSKAKPKAPSVTVLCEIFPQLIQWRLLVSYAPFFSRQPINITPGTGHTRFETSRPPPQRTFVFGDESMQDLRCTVRRTVDAIHTHISTTHPTIDFINLNDTYHSEKTAQTTSPKLTSLISPFLHPTYHILLKTSQTLSIPIYQLELALTHYSLFLRTLTQTHSGTIAYRALTAEHLASHQNWTALAHLTHEDMLEISNRHLFTHSLRHIDPNWGKTYMKTFECAVRKCISRYFIRLGTVCPTCAFESSVGEAPGCPFPHVNSCTSYDSGRGVDGGGKRSCLVPIVRFLGGGVLGKWVGVHGVGLCRCVRKRELSWCLSAVAEEGGSVEAMDWMLRVGEERLRRKRSFTVCLNDDEVEGRGGEGAEEEEQQGTRRSWSFTRGDDGCVNWEEGRGPSLTRLEEREEQLALAWAGGEAEDES